MEVSKVSFGAAWPKKGISKLAGRTRARLGKAPVQQSEQGLPKVNKELLAKMRNKQQFVTVENQQGRKQISAWDSAYRQC